MRNPSRLVLPLFFCLFLFFTLSEGYGQVAESFTDLQKGLPLPDHMQNNLQDRATNNFRNAQFYTDRVTFQAENPGLPLDNFDYSPVPNLIPEGCDEPVNSNTADACFPTGLAIPGYNLQTVEGIRTGCPAECPMITLGPGAIGNPSHVVGPNFFADTYLITFDPPVLSVGMDILNSSDIDVNIVITDDSGNTMNTTSSTNSTTGVFWGVRCPELITSISISSPSDGGELIDNIEFGGSLAPIPVMSDWAVLILGVLSIIIGIVVIKQRSFFTNSMGIE